MTFPARPILLCASALVALVASGCAGQVTVPQSSGGGTGGETSSSQTSGTGTTDASSGAGTSGASSGGGGSSTASACSPLQSATNLLQSSLPASTVLYGDLVSDGQYLYFASETDLYRLPVNGGAAETVGSGAVYDGLIAATRGAVGWLTAPQASENPTGLTVSNGSGVHVVALPSGVAPAWGNILMDGAGDTFFEVNVPGVARSETWMWRAANGTAAEALGVGLPAGGGGTNLYWADRGQVVWSNNATGPAAGLYVTEITTGVAVQVVTQNEQGFGGLVGLDATNIYGAGSICPMGPCTFSVNGVPRAGGPSFVAFQSTDSYWTNGLKADDSGLYWVDWSTDTIFHALLTGGAQAEPVVKLTGGSIPSSFALDTCNVYWLESNTGSPPRVMGIAK